jgi:hypothetical protein
MQEDREGKRQRKCACVWERGREIARDKERDSEMKKRKGQR